MAGNATQPVGSDPDSILRRVKNDVDGAAANGRELNDLLRFFQSGYPTDKVIELLDSDKPATKRAAAWLISELASEVCVHCDRFWHLLDSSDPKIRFSMVDCVIVCAGEADGSVIAKLFEFLGDADSAVRWKALDAIIRLSDCQLKAGGHWQFRKIQNRSLLPSLQALIGGSELAIRRQIERVESEAQASKVEGKLIVAAAIRANVASERLSSIAEILDDDDLRDFLSDYS